ncbi:hypothetical protein T4B_14461 [Trichinella pseudospiralis]|uniref:Uncharacterized protein n=2 Tax=Trichinella pseudospiralis TaxID=6337 RepID=A0A0V1G6A6_TRIPS|nr:hypothetical protein T4D_16906 [Trichinella pseudospiralis]KRZ31609.1 hypothetical protein T4B_14461 [Trichinella pseudospiralis]
MDASDGEVCRKRNLDDFLEAKTRKRCTSPCAGILLKSNDHKEDIDEEARALHLNNTCILADLPPGRKTTKANFNGVVNKYKIKICQSVQSSKEVAKEISQRREIDYMETYTSRNTPH